MSHAFIPRIAIALLLGVAACSGWAAVPARPNVLFIAIDDLNVDLGTFGHRVVRTPNVDRLAARGVKFERAYCQFPLCNPSRQSFLSGLRPETSGVIAQGLTVRTQRADHVYLPGWFRQHGYQVLGTGKIFHVKDPASWDHFDEANSRSDQENAALKSRAAVRQRGEHGPEWRAIDDAVETMGDGIVAQTAVRYLRESARGTRPFFVAAGFRKPHLPWTAPRRFFEAYPRTAIPLRNDPKSSGIPSIALQTDLTGKVAAGAEWQAQAAYYACVSFVDAQIGIILDAMDELRLWDRTVVVLVSDHGFHLGDHGLWGKLTNFERSARVPLVIVPPQTRHAGSTAREIVELIDLYPTLVELSGLPMPANLEGRSLAPQLANPTLATNRPAFTSTVHDGVLGRSVRTDRWRYTEWGGGDAAELYDEEADPGEFRNLINEPAHAEVIAKLKVLLSKNPRLAGPVPRDAQAERKNRKP
jgi:iduronate 2-sulfatase